MTTVPQQALFLMNSPFLHEQARRLAALDRARSPSGSTAAPDGIRRRPGRRGAPALSARVLGRSPEPDELALAIEFVGRQTSPPTDAKSGVEASTRTPRVTGRSLPWEQLSQVLLLTNEFMFVD